MIISEIQARFKRGSGGNYICPAHDDGKASLSINAGNNNNTVMYCHVGCSTEAVLSAVGLQMSDLRDEPLNVKYCNTHQYYDYPSIQSRKYRGLNKNGDKFFYWQHLENGVWVKSRKGNCLYGLETIAATTKVILLVEGEKDVENTRNLNLDKNTAVLCSPDGAGGKAKWRSEYTQSIQFAECVYILCDNDRVGREFQEYVANELTAAKIDVRVIDILTIFSKAREHQDISNAIEVLGKTAIREKLLKAMQITEKYIKTIPKIEDFPINNITSLLRGIELGKGKFALDDTGNAELFAFVYTDRLCYVTEEKQYRFYNGCVWRADPQNLETREMLMKLARTLVNIEFGNNNMFKHYSQWVQGNVQDRILKMAAAVCKISTSEFDKDPLIFNCKNGTLNLKTGELSPHRATDRLSKLANVVYNQNVGYNEWQTHIDRIMSNDIEKSKFLRKWYGYSLSGLICEEKLLFELGRTRAGKGLTNESFLSMLGDYGTTSSPKTLSVVNSKSTGNSHSEDLARLAGIRFVSISEPDAAMEFDVGLIKTLTGGDSVIARNLYQSSFAYSPQFKFCIQANSKPRISDTTIFESGRIDVLRFDEHFEGSSRDNSLKEKYRSENIKTEILNWAVVGFSEYMKEGLAPPQIVQEATQTYALESDKMRRFFNDVSVEFPENRINSASLYTRFGEWCDENGHRGVESQAIFKQKMSRFGEFKSTRINGTQQIAFIFEQQNNHVKKENVNQDIEFDDFETAF